MIHLDGMDAKSSIYAMLNIKNNVTISKGYKVYSFVYRRSFNIYPSELNISPLD